MTKFEEDLKKKLDSEQVPMYITQSGCSMTRKTYIETDWIFDTYKNWRSDEHVQKLVELGGSYVLANKNLMDENEKLAQEIADLKSQLQQQALPEVPECVAEGIESIPRYYSAFGAMLLVKNKFEKCPEDNEDLMYLYNWLFDVENEKNNQDLFVRAWLDGYAVQKPQLFYLKNKLTTSYLYLDHETGYYGHIIGVIDECVVQTKFTQEEIDSMQTGSYEKIEVTE